MKKEIKILIAIFLLALFLRTIKLGTFPIGFHADEVRVAWNALSILKTGSDDRGNILALYYNTFGDYRPTGIFYATIPSLILFGRSEFAIRFPSALFGALTVFPLFFFVKELTKKEKLGYISSTLLAISTWHIEVSRATSEVVISSFFALFGLYYFLKFINTKNKKLLVRAFLLILISYLFYHTIRILAPIFLIIIACYYWKNIPEKIKKYVTYLVGAVLLLTLLFTLDPGSRQRMSQVSIFNDANVNYEYNLRKPYPKLLISGQRFIEEYGSYFNTNFLLGDRARPYRYTTPGTGLLSYGEFGLLIIGIVLVIKGKRNWLPLLLLLAAPIPAALTTEDVPNLHRAFLMLPFLIILEAYGLDILTKNLKKVALVLLTLNLLFFGFQYFFHSQIHMPYQKNLVLDNPSYRNIGAKELALGLEKIKGNYEKIIVTNDPDDVFPWYAFFTGKDPKEFNPHAIQRANGPWQYQNIVFTWSKCPSDTYFKSETAKKILVVDSGECAYQSQIKDGLAIKVVDKILRPDSSEVYVLLERATPQ